MLNRTLMTVCCVLTLATASCGGDGTAEEQTRDSGDQTTGTDTGTTDTTDTTDSTGGDSSTDAGEVERIGFTCGSSTPIIPGLNSGWDVRGQARDFYVDFPSVAEGTPVSVVFVMHGVGDTAANFRQFIGANGANADPDFPFIMVTPQGLRLQPAFGAIKPGMEWDIFQSRLGDQNLEAALFEDVLGCLAQDNLIDAQRIYVVGFSGGAIASNMLHSRYPEQIAAVFAMSGAWFNDADQRDGVDSGFLTINLDWEELEADHGGAVVITHGGQTDTYGDPQFAMAGIENGEIISFEESAQFAKGFLQQKNRTLVDCPHNSGHTNHPNIYSTAILDFFKEHKVGVESPYPTDGLPSGLSSVCTLNP